MRSRKGLIAAVVTTVVTTVGISIAALLTTQPAVEPLVEGVEHAATDEGILAAPFPGTPVETESTQDIVFRFDGLDSRIFPRTRLRTALAPGTGLYAIRPALRPTWSTPEPLDLALDRLARKVGSAALGARWQIRGEGTTLVVFRRDANPAMFLATGGNEAIDILVGTVVARFPDVTNLGVFVCKKIAGSSIWSQHSWGNAVDFGGPGPWGSAGNVALLDKVDAYVRLLATRGYLDVSQFGWRNWANHYPGHSHYSGSPLRSGTPPCAT